MPIDRKPDLFDERCDECGHDGMKKTQAPSRDGPTTVFKCPECGGTKGVGEYEGGSYVDKR